MLALAGLLLVSAGCREESAEVTIEETRPLTTKDKAPMLFATSQERFRNVRPNPVTGAAPAGWTAQPSSQFRLLDYRFGEGGEGEVYVTLAGGGMAANINRWMAQFGKEPLDQAELAALRRLPIAGIEGVWVETEGRFEGAMGKPAADGYALAGVVAESGDKILTIKMIGPAAEVAAQRAALESFAATLKLAD